MPARNEEAEHRIGDAGILEERGLEMGFEMVDADQRLLMEIGEAFGKREADEERADEAGPLGHGVEIDRPRGRRRPATAPLRRWP